MTAAQFTDRRDADDAAWQKETERLDRLTVADEDTVERVARAIAESDGLTQAEWPGVYEERARAAIDALKPAPGTSDPAPLVWPRGQWNLPVDWPHLVECGVTVASRALANGQNAGSPLCLCPAKPGGTG